MLVGRAAAPTRTDRELVRGTLAAWAVGRVATFAGALAFAIQRHKLSLAPRVFTLWDGRWYLELARHGYPHTLPAPGTYSPLAFFPGYPILVGLLGASPVAAVLVAWGTGAVAAVLVARVAERVVGERAALAAAVAFCLFPGSYILSMAYAEGLAIALSAACLLALLDRRWVAAGVWAALAAATRPNALVLVACCVVAAWQARDRRAWIAPLLAPAGLAVVALMQWVATGTPTAWSRAEAAGWHQHVDFGASSARTLAAFLLGPFGHPVIFMVGLGMLVSGVLVLELRHLRPPAVVAVYTAGILALAYSSSEFNGRPRFLLTAFPLLFPLARLPRWAFGLTMAASVVGMAALTWFSAVQAVFPP